MTLPRTCLGCAAQRLNADEPCPRCGQKSSISTRDVTAIAEPVLRNRVASIVAEARRRSFGSYSHSHPHEMDTAQLLGVCARAIEELLAERAAVAASPKEWAQPEPRLVRSAGDDVEVVPVAPRTLPSPVSAVLALAPTDTEEPAVRDVAVVPAATVGAPVPDAVPDRCGVCHREMSEAISVDGLKVCPPKKCGSPAVTFRIALAARARLLPASYRRDGGADAREALRLVERVVREAFRAATGEEWTPGATIADVGDES